MFVGWRPPAFRRPSPLRVRAVYLKRVEKGGPGGAGPTSSDSASFPSFAWAQTSESPRPGTSHEGRRAPQRAGGARAEQQRAYKLLHLKQ
jgi:hypothetical protein